ncbi:MAG TPA: hypothetical protein VEV17_24910 [Bryobacteraceae bacterium]|nr:hypothetical protein [Bryobacteraceae bacterium]
MKSWHTAGLAVLAFAAAAAAQTSGSVRLYVKETGGIRRTAYPVNARIPFPRGLLADPSHARLLLNGSEVPAQYAAETRWADGSVQWLETDFNVSIGPKEARTLALEYGADVRAQAQARGLAVTEDADSIRVGNVSFSKTAAPLIASVKYRGEDIGSGPNGIAVTDAAGTSHDLSRVESLKTAILKRGPIHVVLEYSGRIPLDGNYNAPFVITVEMPNSKSWIKVSAKVQDPAKRLRDLSFQTPLAFGSLPLIWDFGTEKWTYGSLRTPQESVTLTETVKAPDKAEWSVSTGPKGQEQLYDTSVAGRPVAWAHLQDAKEAVAFAIENVAVTPGTYQFTIGGNGLTSFRFAPAQPAAQLQITVYEHFVPPPVQIGAATSPASALSPLVAVCERRQYVSSGVPVPKDAEGR